MSRLGLLVVAAVLSLAVSTSPAGADPTESSQPPVPSEPPPSSETSTPPTESPAPPPTKAELPVTVAATMVEVTAKFDKPEYRTGEEMRIQFGIKNIGTAPETVFAFFDTLAPDLIRLSSRGDLDFGRTVTIAPGATHTTTLVGAMGNPDVTVARLTGNVANPTGTDPAVSFSFTVPTVQRFGRVAGTVFGDENGNGRFDSGEALAGATLTITNQLHEASTFTATTDAAGRFEFPRVPTAPYFFTGQSPDGWLIGFRRVIVEASNDDLLVRAVRPLTDLSVDLEFTKEVYQPAERPVVRVTLKNSGNRPLTGIVANCNRSGEGPGLDGRGPGWGDLADDGVTIGARETKTLEVSEEMPDNAANFGFVQVACDFSYSGVEDDRNPRDFDRAKVPGAVGDITGDITDNGTGVSGGRVVLVTEDRCPIVAEATTDGAGHFELKRVPVGEYRLFMFPPAGWRIEHNNPTSVRLVAPGPSRLIIEAERGSAPAPTLPTQPADCKPAPPVQPAAQGSTAPGLAQTGSNLLLPALAGLIIMLAGAGAVFATRRRRV